MRERLHFVETSKREMKEKHGKKMKEIKKKLARSVSRRQYNQAIKRKAEIIARPRKEKRERKADSDSVEAKLLDSLKKVRRNHRRLKKKLSTSTSATSTSAVSTAVQLDEALNKLKEEKIKSLQDENCVLLDKTDDMSSNVVTTKRGGKTYSSSTRMMVYDALVEQIPTQNISPLLKKVASRMGVEMKDFPKGHSVEQMAS